MTTTLTKDVVTLLKQDHAAAKAAFAEFDSQPSERWGGMFHALSEMLVAHEVAEEVVVYPAIRKLEGGTAMVEERLAEQTKAEQTLVALERLDPRSETFAEEFKAFTRDVLSHAKAEEAGLFALLEKSESPERLGELGKRYADAKAAAPTHPHPHAPNTPPGNLVTTPIAALFDRVRDKMRGFFE